MPDNKKELLDLPSEPTDDIETGFAFEQLVRTLYLNDGPEQTHKELVWGFTLGLAGQPAE